MTLTPNPEYARMVAETQTFDARDVGWTYLGMGAYRRAFLAPDGLVYKAGNCEAGWQSNVDEVYTYRRIRGILPDGWAAAESVVVNVTDKSGRERPVCVQEYADGVPPWDILGCEHDRWESCVVHDGLTPNCAWWNIGKVCRIYCDVHEYNFFLRKVDGEYVRVLIDMG